MTPEARTIFIRGLMLRAGYSKPYDLRGHGRHMAYDYDFPGKNAMQGRHFKTEADAWKDMEQRFQLELKRTRDLVVILKELDRA